MSFASFDDSTEHFSRHDLHLVKNHETPVSILDHIEDSLCLSGSLALSRDHSISGNQNHSFFRLSLDVNGYLIFGVGAESHNFAANMSEFLELLLPLFHWHQILTQNDAALLDCACSYNTSKSLSSTTWQHNHTRASSTIWEHLTQTLFLVGTNLGLGLNFNFELWGHRVMLEVILFNQWEISLDAFFLYLLDSRWNDFDDQILLLIFCRLIPLQR